jgi:hypothetical protein
MSKLFTKLKEEFKALLPSTIYVLVAMLVHYLEHLVDFWREAGSLRGRQPEVACGDRVAAFLGHPNSPGRADSDVLHYA